MRVRYGTNAAQEVRHFTYDFATACVEIGDPATYPPTRWRSPKPPTKTATPAAASPTTRPVWYHFSENAESDTILREKIWYHFLRLAKSDTNPLGSPRDACFII